VFNDLLWLTFKLGNPVNYSDQISPKTEVSGEYTSIEEEDLDFEPIADQELEEKSKFEPLSLLYEIVETLVLAIIIWLLVNITTARYVVEGQSMEPNLHTGQYLIVSRLAYMDIGSTIDLGDPQRGDIVVFDFPRNPADDYVKRVIGLPGEEVTIEPNGDVYVNGTLLDEPYLTPDIPYNKQHGTWEVPSESYFVLGDNRNSSSDSRSWEFLEEQYIVGKAWLSYWPPPYWGIIPHYDYMDGL